MHILAVGPKRLTAREILEGPASRRNVLQQRDRIFAQMPSPLVAGQVAEAKAYERVTATYGRTPTPDDGQQGRDGDGSSVGVGAATEASA